MFTICSIAAADDRTSLQVPETDAVVIAKPDTTTLIKETQARLRTS
jgi:RecB family endonuclease NucS